MEQPRTEIVRRTFNINNFESLTIEGYGFHADPRKAILLAHKDCLLKAQAAMVRIFGVRKNHGYTNDFDGVAYSVVTSEIQGIDAELSSF